MNIIKSLSRIPSVKDKDIILLESQLQGHPSSKRSFLAVGYQSKITVQGERITISRRGEDAEVLHGDPWDALKRFREENPGWHFGYFGYDLKNDADDPRNNQGMRTDSGMTSDLPDMIFIKPEFLVETDGQVVEWMYGDEQTLLSAIGAQSSESIQSLQRILPSEFEELIEPADPLQSSEPIQPGEPSEPVAPGDPPQPSEPVQASTDKSKNPLLADIEPGLSREVYLDKIRDIQQHIKEGDFYELNFSYPMEGRFQGDPFQLYEQMKRVNPVPFGAYLSVEGTQICCASPERFLSKTGKKLLSEPIKGTSARSDDPRIDQINREELLNEKNRAENLMIVDLVRHDLAKVAKTDTVNVEKLFDLQSFGTVHQLISSISCEVDNRLDPVDYIRACFPMGSMTGAPKIEVMKHIDRLEEYKRGVYSGAVGYFTPEGDFDFNVVIRTAIIHGDDLHYPVGGAITSDSEPELEWQETLLKAKSLFRALGVQSESNRQGGI